MQLTGNVQGLIDLVGGGVQDVKVDGVSVVDDENVANITLPEAGVQGVKVDGVSVVNEQGVAEITLPDAPVQGVEVDGISVVNEDGIAEITLPDNRIHYSTNEQVIGTWLDGKPLYQKTVYVANPTISTSLVSIPNAISPNVDTTVEIIGTIDRNLASYGITGCISYDINNTESSNVYNYVRYDKYNDTLMYKCKFDTNTAENLIVTIKYTKTTD